MTLWRSIPQGYTGPGANAICLEAQSSVGAASKPGHRPPLAAPTALCYMSASETPCVAGKAARSRIRRKKTSQRNHTMPDTVVTRFAPSPTGFLHIGGARTALFNWLYARHTGGTMLLRIEDTDRERSTEAATQAILDGLTWLGLHWEGEPISQFERAPRHREVAEELVRLGKAYYCYASPAELDEMREKARAEGRPPRYDGRWRDRDPSEAPAGVKPVIRIKAPTEGETIVHDRVQGDVRFPNKDLDDFIILRSDGMPTYMHAVVVDDHDMGVTHIIRGDDHLTNAARQTIIYQAMGWDVPVMAHIPLIHGADGAKLSKRHGALGVEAYRAMGYLPAALKNYLVRLGWSHGDDEIMSLDDMIRWFEIDDVNKGAGALRLPEAGGAERHLYAPDGQRRAARHLRAHAALSGERQADPRPARRAPHGAVARRHAWPEGAGQDAGRARRRRVVPVRRAPARCSTRRLRRCSAMPIASRDILKGAHKALSAVGRLERRRCGSRHPRICRAAAA